LYNILINVIAENILALKEQIRQICQRLSFDFSKITIVAASKGRSAEEIKQVIESGIFDIGENRIQEAKVKYTQLKEEPRIKWHMIGHLQTNKVKEAVEIFDLIHSLDSVRLAEEINKRAQRINKVQNVLVEVKTSSEATKFGLEPKEVLTFIRQILYLPNIKIMGLMTVAPLLEDPQMSRPYFKIVRELKDEINRELSLNLEILSMGMSNDYTVALQEGTNMLRIGRRIFEKW